MLEPGLGEALLGAALGNRRAREPATGADSRRELTSVRRLIRRLLLILTDGMAQAWAPVLPFQPEVLRFEVDPRMATIAPPTDVGIVSGFEIEGGIEGRLQLVIPYAAVEAAEQKLSSPRRLSQRADERFADALAREVEQVAVEVRGIYGSTGIPFSKMLDLKVGDVMLLDTDEGRPIPVIVQGREKFRATPTISGGSMAMVVDQPLRPPRPPRHSSTRSDRRWSRTTTRRTKAETPVASTCCSTCPSR